MNRLILASLIIAGMGTSIELSAVGKSYTHFCQCAKEGVELNCDDICGKENGFWSGKAILSNTKDTKGVMCYCGKKDKSDQTIIKTVRCDGSTFQSTKCGGRKGSWTGVIGSTQTGSDTSNTIPAGQQLLETLESQQITPLD